MTEILTRHPAEPAEQVETAYGGFAAIAQRLNERHPQRPIPISRQLVDRWYKCRGKNGFPERTPVVTRSGTKLLFHLDTVVLWHIHWLEDREREAVRIAEERSARYIAQQRLRAPDIDTIPLFDVDSMGHPRDRERDGHRGHPDVRENYRGSVLDL